jgi:alcohol dehydrogenase YqhD (iron-dependent ADH family)
MYDFEFDMPTKAVFGEGAVAKVGGIAATFGKKALLVTYDEEFVKKVGFYQKVAESCKAAGVTLVSAFGVKSNPTVEHAAGVIAVARKEKPDVIIALGGGSAIDEAKFVGTAAGYAGDPWDFATGKAPITTTLPVIAVVTIPATSSELNGTSVMSYEKIQRKDGFANPVMRPKYAILDPELTYTIPVKQTAYSAADIVSHLLESYLGHGLGWAPFQEHYCQGSIRTIMECMDRLQADPRDKEARAQMMWTASYAWNGFYPCGLGPADATIHVLGHSLRRASRARCSPSVRPTTWPRPRPASPLSSPGSRRSGHPPPSPRRGSRRMPSRSWPLMPSRLPRPGAWASCTPWTPASRCSSSASRTKHRTSDGGSSTFGRWQARSPQF